LNYQGSIHAHSYLGDGTNTLFLEDRWIASQRIRDLAPVMVNVGIQVQMLESQTWWKWNKYEGVKM
jgi:hypothetical protein